MHVDAVSCRDLDQFASKKRNAEDHRRVHVVVQLAILQDAMTLQMVGGEIDDLLRRAGAFERQRRLGEYRAAASLELLQAVPGVGDVQRGIVAADAILAERLRQARDLAQSSFTPVQTTR